MLLEFLISAFVTLVIVLDPIGLAPTFVAITHGMPVAARRQVAIRASLIAAGVLSGAALIGANLLSAVGISLPAFRIAGGLLLFSIASEMVFGLRIQRQAETAEQAMEERVRNVAAADVQHAAVVVHAAFVVGKVWRPAIRVRPILPAIGVGV